VAPLERPKKLTQRGGGRPWGWVASPTSTDILADEQRHADELQGWLHA
jgi:hypothetical protein